MDCTPVPPIVIISVFPLVARAGPAQQFGGAPAGRPGVLTGRCDALAQAPRSGPEGGAPPPLLDYPAEDRWLAARMGSAG
jgi:hypothetical protein